MITPTWSLRKYVPTPYFYCPKCGEQSPRAHVKYQRDIWRRERLHRICPACGFYETFLPLDFPDGRESA